MRQRVGSSSGGGVPLLPQEMGSMMVNQRLVVAPPGCSKETKGLLARIRIALMDAILQNIVHCLEAQIVD